MAETKVQTACPLARQMCFEKHSPCGRYQGSQRSKMSNNYVESLTSPHHHLTQDYLFVMCRFKTNMVRFTKRTPSLFLELNILCVSLATHPDYFGQRDNVMWAALQTNPVSGKACSSTKGGLICLYMLPLPVSHTTEFAICISIYIRLCTVTLLPPPRSLVSKLGLSITWVKQLRSGC